MAKDPKEIRKVKEDANELARKGKFDEAIKLFTKLTLWDKREVQHHIKIAELAGKLNRSAESVKWYESAARKYAEQGHLPKAIAMAKIILGIDPQHEATQGMLAELYAKKDEGSGAAAAIPGVVLPPAPAPTPARKPAAAVVPKEPERTFDLRTLAEVDADIDDLDDSPEPSLAELPHVPLFSDLSPEEFRAFIPYLEVATYQEHEYVIAEGDAGDSFYVITRGVATVAKEDYAGLNVELAELEDGAFFGEFGYLAAMDRTASVIAKTELEVLVVSRESMDKLIAQHPRVRDVLQQFFKERVLNTLLTISPLFEPFGADEKHEVIRNFAYQDFAAKTPVIQEGQEASGLYVLMNGEVEVVRATEEGTEHLADLHAGEFFGEMSLLTGQPTNATVRTTKKTALFYLPAERFRVVASAYPELVGVMAAFAAERRNYNEAMRKLATKRGELGLV